VVEGNRSKIVRIEELNPAQAVLILGARVHDNGKLSQILADRVDTALEVYNAGKVKMFLVSGDHGQVDYNEVEAIKMYLLEKGIPEEIIILDHAGFETFDSVYRAKNVFGAESLIISTQEFHLYRALYLGSSVGLDVQGVKADRRVYLGAFWNEVRESGARVKAVFDVLTGQKPKFLSDGNEEKISLLQIKK